MRPYVASIAFMHSDRIKQLVCHSILSRHGFDPDDHDLWLELEHHCRELLKLLEGETFRTIVQHENEQTFRDWDDDPF